MSDLIPLPEHTFSVEPDVTFNAPHILRAVSMDGGRETYSVSNGGRIQVSLSVESWLSETPVEPPEVLKFLAQNQIPVGGAVISVLNDAMEYNGKNIAPSNPTASQYLALVGKKVITSPSPTKPAFTCTPLNPNNPLLKQYGRATLYSVKQVSIVLP